MHILHKPCKIKGSRDFQTYVSCNGGITLNYFEMYKDVWAYHKWWDLTNKLVGDKERFLWLRNNGSTLISQFLNNILYTFGAFWGIHDFKTLISIAISSYVIFIVTSLADTPFVYLARRISKKIKE